MGAQVCAASGASFDMCSCTGTVADGGISPVPSCGDGICGPGESAISCDDDCPSQCGDGYCTGPENPMTCPGDCPGYCGDGVCLGDERPATCPADCSAACGDGACTHDETAECESDCSARCGDGYCTHSELPSSCPADCAPVCGDTVCSTFGESCASCSVDCGRCLPGNLEVFVVGALIRPWDNANEPWDSGGAISSILRSDIVGILASAGGPETRVAAIAARIAADGLEGAFSAPDVYGTAGLMVDGVSHPEFNVVLTPTDEDSFQPEFDADGWSIRTGGSIRINVRLVDRDVIADDAIGTVGVDERDLLEAWNGHSGGYYWVQVDDQMTPILFVRLYVREGP